MRAVWSGPDVVVGMRAFRVFVAWSPDSDRDLSSRLKKGYGEVLPSIGVARGLTLGSHAAVRSVVGGGSRGFGLKSDLDELSLAG